MHTVLLLSKYPVYRSGIKLLLLYKLHLHVVETECGKEALAYIRQHHVDLVLVDIELSDSDGEAVLRNIKHSAPELPVLVLTSLKKQQYGDSAVVCISPLSTTERFLAAVQAALKKRGTTHKNLHPP